MTTPKWRTITADQYRVGGDACGDYDEAYIRPPTGSFSREAWDVDADLDTNGNVVIYTAAADPHHVPPDHPIRVR